MRTRPNEHIRYRRSGVKIVWKCSVQVTFELSGAACPLGARLRNGRWRMTCRQRLRTSSGARHGPLPEVPPCHGTASGAAQTGRRSVTRSGVGLHGQHGGHPAESRTVILDLRQQDSRLEQGTETTASPQSGKTRRTTQGRALFPSRQHLGLVTLTRHVIQRVLEKISAVSADKPSPAEPPETPCAGRHGRGWDRELRTFEAAVSNFRVKVPSTSTGSPVWPFPRECAGLGNVVWLKLT